MLFVSTAGFDEDKILSTFGLLFAQRFTLPMLDRDIIGVPVHVFERGKNFAHVPFDDIVERNNLIKARER